jgi:deoxycytidine triphosphate deaminase
MTGQVSEVPDQDPFPNIPPALLNAADIEAYQNALEIFSETLDRKRLKSASYELLLTGEIFRWTKDVMEVDCRELSENQPYWVKPNEIVFISLGTKIKLPSYLALRFNLTISMVHRGLLLGTGPLVDPGFEGNLLIPLHNLTTSPLPLSKGMSFIWVEVTKVSPYPPVGDVHDYKFVPFPSDKRNRKPFKYFERASGNLPISSALQETYDQVRAIQAKLKTWSAIGAIAGVVAIGGLIFAGFSLYFDSAQLAESAKNGALNHVNHKLEDMRREFQVQVDELRRENEELKRQMQR